jgi:hypothetical protein
MKVSQYLWSRNGGWKPALPDSGSATVVFVFGARALVKDGQVVDEVRRAFPGASIAGGSTSGEILGVEVHDDTVVASAIEFADTRVRVVSTECAEGNHSHAAGVALARALPHEGLSHVFVVSNGLHVNGTDLTNGLVENLPRSVVVTGGLTGDAANFQETWVVADGEAGPTRVAAVGFYGDRIRVGYGSHGGWEAFGPLRTVTGAAGAVLRELDGEPALELYKRYLGDHAAELPASALLFPIEIKRSDSKRGVVRTVLAVDNSAGTMTFAGDVAEQGTAQLMHATTDKLVDGATGAAGTVMQGLRGVTPQFAILVSCVGRKLVMKQRVEEEVEAVRAMVGDIPLTGFYSYGELCPFAEGNPCELHNQTMTITAFAEV